jgi:dihydropteroate synthase
VSDIPISIDTRHAIVAEAAVNAGADIVNDVSGGSFDPKMLSTVAQLRVPIVLMHMRGIPETMQNFVKDYSGKGVVEDVIEALNERCDAAEAAGIPRWMQIVDPGIGFAKDLEGNLSLLRSLNKLRAKMRMGASTPILLGTSRKGFLGRLTAVTKPEERDFATVASCVAALCLDGNDVSHGCNIVRVHNVKAMKEAALVMDAIRRAK